MQKKPLILITGACGFIGSGLVRYLNDQGYDNLLLVDNVKSSEKWKNLRQKRFVEILPKEALFSYLEKKPPIEAIFHLGACSSTLEQDGDYLLENNYRYSIKLAQYAIENHCRFIYASSAATYGDGKEGFSDKEENLFKLKPLNLYGFSKHLFDLWLYQNNYLNQVVGLKYFNVFGPNENHKGNMASMVFKMAHIAQKGEAIRLFKSTEPQKYQDGRQVRDFIYVKDAVEMTCSFYLGKRKEETGIFNVGRGKTVTWLELADALFKALEKKPKIEFIDMPKEMVKAYQNFTLADMQKSKEYFSCSSIEDNVQDYVRNYLLLGNRW